MKEKRQRNRNRKWRNRKGDITNQGEGESKRVKMQ